MTFRGFCFTGMATVLGVFALPATGSTTPTADQNVLTLTNFPILKRLAADDSPNALRRYLQGVSGSYRRAGYETFASVLGGVEPMIRLFSHSQNATSRQLKQGRATLRRLEASLRLITSSSGAQEISPNYHSIATTFVKNSHRVLSRIAARRNPGLSLVKSEAPFWMDSYDENNSGSFYGAAQSIGSFTVISIETGGEYVLSTSGLDFTEGRWVAFPPTAEIPDSALTAASLTLGVAYLVNDLEYPAGTRLQRVSEDFVLPEGAVLLSIPVHLSPVLSTTVDPDTTGSSEEVAPAAE